MPSVLVDLALDHVRIRYRDAGSVALELHSEDFSAIVTCYVSLDELQQLLKTAEALLSIEEEGAEQPPPWEESHS